MTAVLSFAAPGIVTFRSDVPGVKIDESWALEREPPFRDWTQAYAIGDWSDEVLRCIGLHVGRWLDGKQQCLAQLLQTTAPVILTIEASTHPDGIERDALDAPWELIAGLKPDGLPAPPALSNAVDPAQRDPLTKLMAQLGSVDLARACHLALDPRWTLTVVRRLGEAAEPRRPSPYRPSVVFMAAQPDGLSNLQVDHEEAEIRRAVGGIGMDLAVEDSGSLQGLAEMVARVDECDVVQVSGHGRGGRKPALVLEDELGKPHYVTADDLSNGFGAKPPLVFLSACSSAAAAPTPGPIANAAAATLGSEVTWPLSHDLCRRGWPAILGWAAAVSDPAAIEFASALYRQLARRAPLTKAFAGARESLATGHPAAWHKPRLFVGPDGGGLIVDGTDARTTPPPRDDFLDPPANTIPIAARGKRSPYRRALQRVMVAMRIGQYRGIVIHGGDELARATVAGTMLQRLDGALSRVVVARHFSREAILKEIGNQTNRHEVDTIVATALADKTIRLSSVLTRIITGPCREEKDGAFVLVLHGFNPTSPAQANERHVLTHEMTAVARELISAFAGPAARTASRLLFTSTAPFSVIDSAGIGIARSSLLAVSLPAAAGVTGGAGSGAAAAKVEAERAEAEVQPTAAVERVSAPASRPPPESTASTAAPVVPPYGIPVSSAVPPPSPPPVQPSPLPAQPPLPTPGPAWSPTAGPPSPTSSQPPTQPTASTLDPRVRRAWLFIGVAGAALTVALIGARMCGAKPQPVAPHDAAVDGAPATPAIPDVPQPSERASGDCPAGMVPVPAGTFHMGSPDGVGDAVEHPQHEVTLSAYCIDKTEVTVHAYAACVAAKVCSAAGDGGLCNLADKPDHPVNCVDWNQATAYCTWADKRLPTEAEWEYAARGTDSRVYPWGIEPPTAERATFGTTSTAPVGKLSKGASPFGALDMAGNVWEWTADWYGAYTKAPVTSPPGPKSGSARVIRGGGFSGGAAALRAGNRHDYPPAERYDFIGVRCARTIDVPP